MLRLNFLLFCICLISSLTVSAGLVRQIDIDSNLEIAKRYRPYFLKFKNKEFNEVDFKLQIDNISKELFEEGYFFSKLTFEVNPIGVEGEDKKLFLKIDLGPRVFFKVSGTSIFTPQELIASVKQSLKLNSGKVDLEEIKKIIGREYENKGVFKTKVEVKIDFGKDSSSQVTQICLVNVREGKKAKLRSLNFKGNSFFSRDQIWEMLEDKFSPLTTRGFFDRMNLAQFPQEIKKFYQENGFSQVEVSEVQVNFDEQFLNADVEIDISEKQQTILREIKISDVPRTLEESAKIKMKNKIGEPLNFSRIEDDLASLIKSLQDEGYFFASIKNLNSSDLIVYSKDFSSAVLSPQIELGEKICFGELAISGLKKTKSQVVAREFPVKPGALITPDDLNEFRQKLVSLNLFSAVRIAPYVTNTTRPNQCVMSNVVVTLKEKDFGIAEIAPGYRTDLGLKLSAGLTYNNLWGLNRQFSFKGMVNHRFEGSGVETSRRNKVKNLLEYQLKTSFTEPFLFHPLISKQIEFDSSLSWQRKRFYNFDADILKISPQFSHAFNRNVSAAIKYQFERIIQFNGTLPKDDDNFSIGGITPSLTLDFRDDPLLPKKGAYFNLSSEFANPYFGSMKQSDLIINFVKVTSRNRFYFPISNFIFAFSISGGYEHNFANEPVINADGTRALNANNEPKTRGYIPSIKVFRLDGYDEIRGFDDGEINRLRNGTPIGDLVVQNDVYFMAMKFEPRYNVTDSFQLGWFVDAGRLYVDHFQPMSLRSSTGLSFKVLTQVGSLDFDYGVKLRREKDLTGNRESFGRFHLSIGFF